MRRHEASDVAASFWARVGAEEPFPRTLEQSILWALPLTIVKLPRLRLSKIQEWLAHRAVPSAWTSADRELRACLIASRGHGVVFLDGADPADELRFSLAHEAAHFMLDHIVPRERAVAALGDSIVGVLDGDRTPTVEERLSAMLRGVELRTLTHLLDRSADGDLLHGHALSSEDRADRLALELLAPRGAIATAVRGACGESIERAPAEVVSQLLRSQFGLPSGVAASYAAWLSRARRPSKPIREWLGMESRETAVELRRPRGNKHPRTEETS